MWCVQADVDKWRVGEDEVDFTVAVSMMASDVIVAAMQAEKVLE
jgi:hypothetical protein